MCRIIFWDGKIKKLENNFQDNGFIMFKFGGGRYFEGSEFKVKNSMTPKWRDTSIRDNEYLKTFMG